MGDSRLELDGEHVRAQLLSGRGTNGGSSLVVDGTTQSHVNPLDPLDLQLEYTRLIAAMIDGCRERGRPLRVLHLGAGALTIPRYVGATRPGSVQHVVELHRELFEFVVAALPLADDVHLTVEFDDGRQAVERAVRVASGYDLAIVDVFSGSISPRHMSTQEFFASLARLLTPDGIVIVNTLATEGLVVSREVTATLRSGFADVLALAAPPVVEGNSLGNIVIAASAVPLPGEEFLRRADTGPRPIELLRDESLVSFVGDALPRRDGDQRD